MTLSRAANFRYSLLKLRHAVAEVTSSASPNISLASAIQSTLEAYKARLTTVIAFTGASMAPTLNPDASSNPSAVERLLVRQIGRPSAKNIFVGDMVALHSPLAPVASAQNVLVRRVAAMEGDEMVSDDPETEPFSLPEGTCWVLADNKELQPPDVIDSRAFGPLSLGNIVGRHSAVAGCAAGATTVLALQPLDVIKTRLQVQDGVKGALPAYRGTLHAATCMIRDEGFLSLYSGAGVAWGVYFYAYNAAKRRYRRQTGLEVDEKLPPWLHLASAAEAGTIVSHGAIQFAAYEELKSLMLSRRARPAPSLALSGSGPPGVGRAGGAALSQSTDQLSTFEVTICGSLSKLVASVSTYPSQVIRARMQQRQPSTRSVRYVSVLHTLRQTLRREGVAGLYRGLVPNVLRVMPQSAITFVVYEAVSKALERGQRREQERTAR
ncbi:hypothetical protein QBZ16_005458 [Prototheca wickerhamii]|uniref:Uncharacterized protein n=1 Tax=Prototheca wickerhamii TaxID=3111 RepID=A0AAD9MKN8_PROWI|nr:hypothetical protein QBZ16_005458 [Prototheca wickerhamii]